MWALDPKKVADSCHRAALEMDEDKLSYDPTVSLLKLTKFFSTGGSQE